MNREIKFRAWDGRGMRDASYGDWISFDGVSYTEAGRKYDTPHVEIERAKDYTLMQYTGLKDKNGKEIYEGDIVQYILGNPDNLSTRYTEEVSYQGSGFCVGGYCPVDATTDWEVEVIGNIHENPDLIKTQ